MDRTVLTRIVARRFPDVSLEQLADMPVEEIHTRIEHQSGRKMRFATPVGLSGRGSPLINDSTRHVYP